MLAAGFPCRSALATESVTTVQVGISGLLAATVHVPAGTQPPNFISGEAPTTSYPIVALVVVKAYPNREFSSQLLACALPAGDSATCQAAMELFLTQTPVVSDPAALKGMIGRIAVYARQLTMQSGTGEIRNTPR